MNTRYYSDKQEQYLAKILNGEIVSNSGGTRFGGGDVLTEHFLVEAKTPTQPKQSFTIKKDWIHKMEEQSFEQGKSRCALAFQFEPNGRNYVVIDIEEFKEYVELLEEEL